MLLEGFRQGEFVSLGRGQLEFGSLVPDLQHKSKSIGSALQDVPTRPRRAADRVAGSECIHQNRAQRQAP
jgi:hypothetical protein